MVSTWIATALIATSMFATDKPYNPLEACGIEKEELPFGVRAYTLRSKLLKRKLCYLVVMPHGGIKKNKVYPLMVVLHGLRSNPAVWVEIKFHQLLRWEMRKRRFPHVITVIPAGFDGYWSNWKGKKRRYADALIHEYLPHVRARFNIDPNPARAVIAGISVGGYGALTLGLQHPNLFKNIVAMSPTDMEMAIEDDPRGRMRVYRRMFGDPPDMRLVRRVNPVQQIKRRRGQGQNFFLIYGLDEPRKFLEGGKLLGQTLQKRRMSVDIREVQGGRHTWSTTWHHKSHLWWLRKVAKILRSKKP